MWGRRKVTVSKNTCTCPATRSVSAGNANMRFIRSGEGQAEGLLKGDLHFALSSTEGIMQNAERGGPLRMIAANSGRLSHYIVTQRKFQKVEELKGATVGILTLTEGSFFNWQVMALQY